MKKNITAFLFIVCWFFGATTAQCLIVLSPERTGHDATLLLFLLLVGFIGFIVVVEVEIDPDPEAATNWASGSEKT